MRIPMLSSRLFWTTSLRNKVSAKYFCGFSDPEVCLIIVVDRYLDYFTTIMGDKLWQVLAKPVSRWRNRSGLSMNAARYCENDIAVSTFYNWGGRCRNSGGAKQKQQMLKSAAGNGGQNTSVFVIYCVPFSY